MKEIGIDKPGDFFHFVQAFRYDEELPHFHVVMIDTSRTVEEGQFLYYIGQGDKGNYLFSPDHAEASIMDMKRAVRFARYMSRKDGPWFLAFAHTDTAFTVPPPPVKPARGV